MIERRPPSHWLTVRVPLDLDGNPEAYTDDHAQTLQQALDLILAASRLGTLGLLCNNIDVSIEPVIQPGTGPEVSAEPGRFSDEPY